jgi:hypothetical protein
MKPTKTLAVASQSKKLTDSEVKEKVSCLTEYWKTQSDSTAKRLIMPILTENPTRLASAILADDLEAFNKNYKEKDTAQSDALLLTACLCGSRHIADLLLEQLGSSYTDEKRPNVLAYAATSPNIEWAHDIAAALAKAGKKMPDEVYGVAPARAIDLLQIFEGGSVGNSPKANKGKK